MNLFFFCELFIGMEGKGQANSLPKRFDGVQMKKRQSILILGEEEKQEKEGKQLGEQDPNEKRTRDHHPHPAHDWPQSK